ncbi:hypothetical protein BDFB_009323, partial [Asbolus verrucosus]
IYNIAIVVLDALEVPMNYKMVCRFMATTDRFQTSTSAWDAQTRAVGQRQYTTAYRCDIYKIFVVEHLAMASKISPTITHRTCMEHDQEKVKKKQFLQTILRNYDEKLREHGMISLRRILTV